MILSILLITIVYFLIGVWVGAKQKNSNEKESDFIKAMGTVLGTNIILIALLGMIKAIIYLFKILF
ncbi:hypothetical protein HMPREF3181_00910 [Parvimonas sp. KA00067]|nr:hypothetical protein HMPREF3181_00910 [Parvimonas sp. KA00067]